jgi:hypothetical protein
VGSCELGEGSPRCGGAGPRAVAERPADGGNRGGEGEGESGGEADAWAPGVGERGERGRVLVLGQAGCAREGGKASEEGARAGPWREKERGVEARGRRESGPAWPMREEGGERESWAGLGGGLGCFLFFLLLSFSFSILNYSNKTI